MRILMGLIGAMVFAGVAMAEDMEAAFQDKFTELVGQDTRFATGAAYAVGSGAPVRLVHGSRFKDSADLVGLDAAWHIGSISKSFTSALTVKVGAREGFTLDSMVGSLVPHLSVEMHDTWKDLTLRQLLSHTGGMRPNFTRREMLRSYGDDLRAARLELLRAHWSDPLSGTPGAFVYSNVGYVLASALLESITDTSWEDLVRAEFAEPLGLTSLGFGPPLDGDAAWGHQSLLGMNFKKEPSKPKSDNPRWLGPAGTIHLSMVDLVAWGQAHLAACRGELPSFLSVEDCAVMHTPVEDNYGLGWVIETKEALGTKTVWHNGSNTMWYAVLMLIPEHDLVLAYSTNVLDSFKGDAIVAELAKVLLEARAP